MADSLCHAAQGLITGLMPVTIVVCFEMVDVEQQDRVAPVLLGGALPQFRQLFVKYPAILRAGQAVMLGERRYEPAFEKCKAGTLLEMPGGQREAEQTNQQECTRASRDRLRHIPPGCGNPVRKHCYDTTQERGAIPQAEEEERPEQ